MHCQNVSPSGASCREGAGFGALRGGADAQPRAIACESSEKTARPLRARRYDDGIMRAGLATFMPPMSGRDRRAIALVVGCVALGACDHPRGPVVGKPL